MRRHARVGITRPLLLKQDGLFLLTDDQGRIEPPSGLGLGLFYRDCRYVARYALTLAGNAPIVLSAAAAAGNAATLDATNQRFAGDGATVPEHGLSLLCRRSLDGSRLTLEDHVTLRNCTRDDVAFTLAFTLEARFEDIFALRGQPPKRRGALSPPSWNGQVLRFRYDGADGVRRELWVTPSVAVEPVEIIGNGAILRVPVALAPQAVTEIGLDLRIAETCGDAPSALALDTGAGARAHDAHALRSAKVVSDDPRLDAVTARALGDLDLLATRRHGRRFLAAGVPWFVALFGRDSLVPALQSIAFDPDLAADTLRLLARDQGERRDPERKEEPGKILHEYRVGEMANLDEAPQNPGYGSIDSTILFLIAVAAHAEWTGSLELFGELRGAVDRALRWLSEDADGDGDGYVDYDNGSSGNPANQGWKDSADAITHPDGSLVRGRIALVEVQGYVYRAKIGLATLYRQAGDDATADRLAREAAELRMRVNRDFWMADEAFFCLALAEGKQVRVVSSNPGQALWTGIVDEDKAAATSARLMASDLFSGWGIRTLSERAARFNPIGYHIGGVWPFDNSVIAAGLARHGFVDAARRVFAGLRDAALHFDLLRLPEFFSGVARRPGAPPARCPRADPLQAWSAGAMPMMLTALLGLEPDGFTQRLRVVRPCLPPDVTRLALHGVRIGQGRVDLQFAQRGDAVSVEVLATEGKVQLELIQD